MQICPVRHAVIASSPRNLGDTVAGGTTGGSRRSRSMRWQCWIQHTVLVMGILIADIFIDSVFRMRSGQLPCCMRTRLMNLDARG